MSQEIIKTLTNLNESNIIIPEYIYNATLLNKFNIVDLTVYSKVRQFLSIEDVATLVAVNRNIFKSEFLADCNYQPFLQSDEEKSEFERSVVTLSNSEVIISSIKTYLQTSKSIDYSDKVPYKFIVLNNIIAIVVSEGFINYTNNINNGLTVIKDYLKVLYSRHSLRDVSNFKLFLAYVNALQKSVS